MPSKSKVLKIIRNRYPSFRTGQMWGDTLDILYRKVWLTEESQELEFHLRAEWFKISIVSVRPFKGIVSCRDIYPCYSGVCHEDDNENMNYLGCQNLFKVLDEAVSMYKLIRHSPVVVNEMYRIAFARMRENVPDLEFGKVEMATGSDITVAMAAFVRKKYGLKVEGSINVFNSFQNIVVNHPYIFRYMN